MRRKPTPKQQRFSAEYVDNGGNGVQAALKTYNTDDYNTANQIAIENLQKPIISREIDRLMKKADLKPEHALRAIKDGLGANNKGGPNHPVRLKAADMTLKLHDAYPRGKDVSHQHSHAHLHMAMINEISQLSWEEIDELEAELHRRDKARKMLRDKQRG